MSVSKRPTEACLYASVTMRLAPQVMSRIDLQTVRVTDTKVQFCGTRRYFRCPSAANGIKCQGRFEKRGIRGVL